MSSMTETKYFGSAIDGSTTAFDKLTPYFRAVFAEISLLENELAGVAAKQSPHVVMARTQIIMMGDVRNIQLRQFVFRVTEDFA